MIKNANALRSALSKCGKLAAKDSRSEPLTYRCDCRHTLSGKNGQIADLNCGFNVTLTLLKLTAVILIIAFHACMLSKRLFRSRK